MSNWGLPQPPIISATDIYPPPSLHPHQPLCSNWLKQDWMQHLFFIVVGVLYGLTNVCAGHPFDTIKTKMQAQTGFESQGMFRSFIKTLKADGIRGLYRSVAFLHFTSYLYGCVWLICILFHGRMQHGDSKGNCPPQILKVEMLLLSNSNSNSISSRAKYE